MVKHGQALDWPPFSHGAYAGQQANAKAAKIGVWVGTFQTPWDRRAAHAEGAKRAASKPPGIISRRLVIVSLKVRKAASQTK
ncbi:hypothetical protein [Mesorhizobium sp. M0239]|uniref:hypothetical protein n=1 Tax=Mesorhizobium sp. M0239 TaxID=2956924 RepID=UPI003335866E